MKYFLIALAALTLSGCTVATHSSGDYASLSILTDNYARGDICASFSIQEEHELIRQLQDPSIDVILIEDHLIEKYGKNVVVDCYAKVVEYHNNQLHKVMRVFNERITGSDE